MAASARFELANARVKVLCLTTWLRGNDGGERWIRTTEPEGTDLQSVAFSLFAISPNGAENRNRTRNLLITNQLLYQLSYFGIKMVGDIGLEPMTPCL